MDCVGFISVSVGEYEWEEDAPLFGGLLGFRSRLGVREMSSSERSEVSCASRGYLPPNSLHSHHRQDHEGLEPTPP